MNDFEKIAKQYFTMDIKEDTKMVKAKVKEIWKSKTVWINGLGLLAGIALAIQGELALGGILTVGTVVNLILRVVTKEAVKWK